MASALKTLMAHSGDRNFGLHLPAHFNTRLKLFFKKQHTDCVHANFESV